MSIMQCRLSILVVALAATWSLSSTAHARTAQDAAGATALHQSQIWVNAFKNASHALYAVDLIRSSTVVVPGLPSPQPLLFPTGAQLLVSGWAIDGQTRVPGRGVIVIIDGRERFHATYGLSRPDVARAVHMKAAEHSGFTVYFPTSNLSLGIHHFRMKLVSKNGTTSSVLGSRVAFQTFRLAALTRPTIYSVDIISGHTLTNRGQIKIPTNAPLNIGGWAVDSGARAAAGGVLVSVDDKVAFQARYHFARPDVARVLHNQAYAVTGFNLSIPGRQLTRGSHFLRLLIVAKNYRAYYAATTTVKFTVG